MRNGTISDAEMFATEVMWKRSISPYEGFIMGHALGLLANSNRLPKFNSKRGTKVLKALIEIDKYNDVIAITDTVRKAGGRSK